jgi:uncharacterized membrane protein YdjX (TVP38/TMEM64 family)
MRLLLVILVPAVVLLLPFLLLGGWLDAALGGPQLAALLAEAGGWAWLVGIALLVADLALPILSTAVMAALGAVYGPVVGGLIAALGSFLSGAIGYLVCRRIGRRAALWLLGERDLRRATFLADRHGGWLVAVSRAPPLMPEAIACAAGLVGMRPTAFFTALACGALPMGIAFASLGQLGAEQPLTTLLVAVLLPVALWPLARRLLAASGSPDPALEREGGGEAEHGQECHVGAAGSGEKEPVQ